MTPDELVAAREAETLDKSPTGQGHCKHPSHLRVIVQAGVGHSVGDTTVRVLDPMVCVNATGYHSWGALLHHAGKQEGLHLFPDAVDFMVSHLTMAAAEAREAGGMACVAIQHTFDKKLITWRLFTPDAADQLAADLEQIVTGRLNAAVKPA